MTEPHAVVHLSKDGEIAVITVDNPPVNALSPDVLDGLYDCFEEAIGDTGVKAIALVCAGRTFIAGADIKTVGKVQPKADFSECQARIERSSKPVVAAIHGTALGGGLEVALTCHYRIAISSAKLGLPEVALGLLPGGGGTQRLPRVVGVANALDMMISGKHIPAGEALELGLIDALVDGPDLRAEAVAFARALLAEGKPAKRARDRVDMISKADPEDFAAARKLAAKTRRGQIAPEAIIRCVEAATAGDFDAGLEVEKAEFRRLIEGPQSAALRHIFFAERKAARIVDMPADIRAKPIAKVAVIGAGTMGGGIAMNFLNVGIPVSIIETTQEALDRGLAAIAKNYASTVSKGRLSEADAQKRQALLTPTLDFNAVADVDLVIEAVFENLDLKKTIFEKLGRTAKPEAILATNTSFLNVDAIGEASGRAEQVLGMHFFSPANVMRLLEVVRGEKTDPQTLATVMALGRKIGKVPAVSRVCEGFIGNRMLRVRQPNADRMMLEGIAPERIDRVLTDFGFPMGPFAMMDMAGLDVGWSRETSKSATVRDLLNECGRHGLKTKAGFYDYDENRRPSPSAVTAQIAKELSQRLGITPRDYSDEEILDWLLLPLINEGARILEEGIAQQASDIDVVWVYGYGWPAYTGGPMYHADRLGLSNVVEALKRMNIEPARILEERAKNGTKLGE